MSATTPSSRLSRKLGASFARRSAITSRGKTALRRSRCAGNRDNDEEEKDREQKEANADQPPPAAQEMHTNRTLLGGPPEGEGVERDAVREAPVPPKNSAMELFQWTCDRVKVGPGQRPKKQRGTGRCLAQPPKQREEEQ